MGYYTTAEIVKIVNKLIDRCGTRDPYKVAKELGINIIYRNFDKQRGAYKVILKNRFVFLKNGMHPVVEQIVLWHEIGHDVLHRKEAVAVGGFKEFNIFEMRENRMEYEANIFASQASLPDDTILEYIENGYDIQQIARAMSSDINLIALKVDICELGFDCHPTALQLVVLFLFRLTSNPLGRKLGLFFCLVCSMLPNAFCRHRLFPREVSATFGSCSQPLKSWLRLGSVQRPHNGEYQTRQAHRLAFVCVPI